MPSSPETARFITLLTKHQAALFVFVRSFVNVVADAEDILQETNLALWENAEKFDQTRSFYTYATKIAYHKICDHSRRNRKLGGLIFDTEILDRICARISDDADGEKAARHHALEGCVSKLSAEDRDLLDQRYGDGKTIRDLVARAGKTETTLQYHFARIRSLLRDCIERKTREVAVR